MCDKEAKNRGLLDYELLSSRIIEPGPDVLGTIFPEFLPIIVAIVFLLILLFDSVEADGHVRWR